MATEPNSNTQQPSTAVAKTFSEKSLESVKNRIMDFIETGDIRVPQNYSVENNLRMAWLVLQDQVDRNDKPVLEVCTAASISNAMLKMIVQGLSLAKHQCAFIAYGNKLTFQRQYQGSIALAKRMSNVVDVKANAIYKGDDFIFEVNAETGVKRVIKHVQTLDAMDVENVVGAYAILKLEDGSYEHEIMNIKRIRKSWEMGATNGTSKAHKNFTDDMACKTVINHACKLKIESSDDGDLYKDDEDVDIMAATSEAVKDEIKTKAHKKSMSFDDAEVVHDPDPAQPAKEQPAPEQGGSEDTKPKMAF